MNGYYCITAACLIRGACSCSAIQPTPYGRADDMSIEDAKYWTKQLEEYYYQKEYVGENNPRTIALRTILQKKGLLEEEF